MDDVITISSGSESGDSDVEAVGSGWSAFTAAPETAVRVDVDAVNVRGPTCYIDLTDPRWSLQDEDKDEKQISTPLSDLTESNVANITENLPPDDVQVKKGRLNEHRTSNEYNFNLQKSSSRDQTVVSLRRDCGDLKPKQRRLDYQTLNQIRKAHNRTPAVKLKRMPFLETHVTKLKTSRCSVCLPKSCTQMLLHLRQLDSNSEAPERISDMRTAAASNCPPIEPSLDVLPPKVTESLVRQEHQENSKEFITSQLNAEISQQLQLSPADSPCSDGESTVATSRERSSREDERDDFCSFSLIPSSTFPSSPQDEVQGSLKTDSGQSHHSHHSPPHFPTTGLDPSEPFDFDYISHTIPVNHNLMSPFDQTPTSEHILAEWQSEEVKADEESNSPDFLHCSIPSEPALSVFKTEDNDDGSEIGICGGDLGIDSPVSFIWQEGSDGEQVNTESRFDMDFRAACTEDRHFVCPVALRKIMYGPAQVVIDEEDEEFGTPEVLCRQSLSLVYSTIDENYPEGTLQLLSDLLRPGYYPPRDITFHLLRGILLNPQCPHHLCVQAFNLLMRTQRHHMADKTTVPWDWELLTSVMANQDHTRRYGCEMVRMLLEYVVQTLEDDFQAKRSTSSLNNTIAKATLSCDQQFPHVRDVIQWLFSAIMKSTEHADIREATSERDEQNRMVSILQRMLSLALEVDRSPALNSAKLSQELFHMLISKIPLRAHRMLLLDSLQSWLLRCKLLEHLLDYACPLKISLPMSLSLLLHFLKNCTLAPDLTDGTERWQKWEELIHLLWMLLLSYNKAMKGFLCSSVTEQRDRVSPLVYKQDDMVSKPAVREAVEAFLSRSQADLGQALPLHVEESLTYLQDHLLDVCQC